MLRRAWCHEDAIFALVVLAAAMPAAIALLLVWLGDLEPRSRRRSLTSMVSIISMIAWRA